MAVVALAVLPVCCVLVYTTLNATQEAPAKRNEAARAGNLGAMAPVAQQPNESLSREAGKEITKEPASTGSTAPSTGKSPGLRNDAKHESAKDPKVSVNWHSALRLPIPRFEEEAKTGPLNNKDSYQAKKIGGAYDFFAG